MYVRMDLKCVYKIAYYFDGIRMWNIMSRGRPTGWVELGA